MERMGKKVKTTSLRMRREKTTQEEVQEQGG